MILFLSKRCNSIHHKFLFITSAIARCLPGDRLAISRFYMLLDVYRSQIKCNKAATGRCPGGHRPMPFQAQSGLKNRPVAVEILRCSKSSLGASRCPKIFKHRTAAGLGPARVSVDINFLPNCTTRPGPVRVM